MNDKATRRDGLLSREDALLSREHAQLVRDITRRVLEILSAGEEYTLPLPARAGAEPPFSGADAAGIPIGVSARHVHLTEECLRILFGDGYALTHKKTLMGGQFAAGECVTVVGANLRAIEKVRVIGPLRSAPQVEISRTDGFALGLNPPVRDSGDLRDASPVTLVGPQGSVFLKNSCIIAKRHVHMSPRDADIFQAADGDIVNIKMDGERGGVMENVLIRVNPSYTLEMHIDTDEANAFGITGGARCEIIDRGCAYHAESRRYVCGNPLRATGRIMPHV